MRRNLRDGWCTAGEVDFLSTSFSCHRNDFSAGGSTDNAVIHQEYVPVFELGLHGIQLAANALLSGFLFGHDERSEDITILNKTLAIWLVQIPSNTGGGSSRSLGNGYNDVNVFDNFRSEDIKDPGGEAITHPLSAAVYADSVDDRVRAGKVDIFEDIGRIVSPWGHLTEDWLSTFFDDDSFTWLNITEVREAKLVQSDRLGSHHVVRTGAICGGSGAENQGTDAIGVTETKDTETYDC